MTCADGQRQQHDRRGRGLRGELLQTAQRREVRRQPHGERRLRVRAEDQARERDADLAGGDVAIERLGRLEHRQQPGGERIAVGGQLLDAAAPDADGGELGGDVQGVDEDQRR